MPDNEGRRITLNVAVTDKTGAPITGLVQSNFTLLDNKQPRPLVDFRSAAGNPPPQVILVLDQVNTTWTIASFERTQLLKFLQANGGRLSLPVSLAFFTDTATKTPVDPTLDGNALVAALNEQQFGRRIERQSEGLNGAADRMQTSLKALGEIAQRVVNKPGRKLVIWISPGWELLTSPRIDWMFTNRTQQAIFRDLINISDGLRVANITLSSIDPLGSGDTGGFATIYYRNFVKGV